MTRRQPSPAFSEKGFYLEEFRGRTLALCASDASAARSDALLAVVGELARGGARVLVVGPPCDAGGMPTVAVTAQRLEGEVWRALRHGGGVRIELDPGCDRVGAWKDIAKRLGVAKLVWIDPQGGIDEAGGGRDSFVDLEELRGWVEEGGHPRADLLGEVEAILDAGVAAVNVCTLEGLADELFTYVGSGTLFTRERYLVVRRLTLADYDAAADLMARGVEEGYLTPRSESERDRILAGGLGAFVEGAYLAGVGALLVDPEGPVGEIASLYTLTRFQGEGVGAHLVAHALECAAEQGLARVFACTTRERVGAFFTRQGFTPVDAEELPARRWAGYDPARRDRLSCYVRVLEPA